jgi:hypothetical protein
MEVLMSATELNPEEAMFLSVIYSFHAAAMQQMGKVANPLTGEIERNLGTARGAIDTLMVLQKRTAGNLTELEDKTLKMLIQELQLNYVDEAKRGEETPTPAEPATPESESAKAEESNEIIITGTTEPMPVDEEPVPSEAPEPAEPEETAAETTAEAAEDIDVAWLEKEEEEAEEEPETEAEEKPKKKAKKKKPEKKKG